MLTIRAICRLAEFFSLRAEATLRKLAAKPIQDVLGKIQAISSYLKEFSGTKDQEDQQYVDQLTQLFTATSEVAVRLLASLKMKNWPEAERAYIQISRLIVSVKSLVESINDTDPQILSDEQGRNVGQPVTQVIDELRSSISIEYDQSGAIQANEQLRVINPGLYETEEPESDEGDPGEETSAPYEYEMVEEPEIEQGGFQEEVEQGDQKQRQKNLKMKILSPQEREMFNQKRRQDYHDRKRQDPNFVVNENQRKREYERELYEAIRTMRMNPTMTVTLPQWILNRKSKENLGRNQNRQIAYQEAYKRMKQYLMSDEELNKLQKNNQASYEEIIRNRMALNLAKEKDPETFAALERMAKVWRDKLDYISNWKREKQKARQEAKVKEKPTG